MIVYVRMELVFIHDFQPFDYGASLFFAGIDTIWPKYMLELGTGDPGEPPEWDTFDYAELRLGAYTPIEPLDFGRSDIYFTEAGSSSNYRWIIVDVPDDFAPSNLFDPTRVPIPDAEGWVDVVTDALVFAAQNAGVPNEAIQLITQSVDLYLALESHLNDQLSAITRVLDDSITPEEFDSLTTDRMRDLRNDLLNLVNPALGPVADSLDLVYRFDGVWNLPKLYNEASATEILDYRNTLIGNDRLVIISGNANDVYQLKSDFNFVHAGGGNDVVSHQHRATRFSSPDDPDFSLSGVSVYFGGSGNDWFRANITSTIDLGTGYVFDHGDLPFRNVSAYIHGFENIAGGISRDTLIGDSLSNIILADEGDDTVNGAGGSDSLYGEEGSDTIYGGQGVDSIDGGIGNDLLYGDAENDVLSGGSGNDRIDGGAGRDVAYFSGATAAAVNLNLTAAQLTGHGTDILLGIESIITGSGNDRLTGDSQRNTFLSNAGNDTLSAGAGNDALFGGSGNDVLYGGSGSDFLSGGSGDDRFSYAAQGDRGDTITDFIAANDRFAFQTAGFQVLQGGTLASLAAGTLNAAFFRAGSTNTAADGNDFFVFRNTDNTLWFDADGNGSQRAAIMIADMQTGATMSAADVLLI